VLVHNCHALSKATWQSLLKPIEEPPVHVFWAFCTTEPDKVPETIRTRCLTYSLKAVSDDDLIDLLTRVAEEEGLDTTEEIIGVLARQADGSARRALVYLAQCDGVKDKKTAMQLVEKGVGEEDQAIALARMLCTGKGCSFLNAMKLCVALQGESAEGVRLIIVNYAAKMLPESKDPESQLAVLEAFRGPWNPSEKLAPLYLALGNLLF
jgi:DNA polymerase III gamma/tau subunit